ncbi:MAG: carboxypeptidase-like regulatory domain-containing protein [Acidimicrobiales bacterium]
MTGDGLGARWRQQLPIRTWRAAATTIVVLVPMLAISALMIRGGRSAELPDLKAPKGAPSATLAPPSTLVASLTGIELPAVAGTTTTPGPPLTGTARLTGAVSGPDGAIPGAIVHVERVDGTVVKDAAAGDDARYLIEGLPGGRYRLRAFQPPFFAQTRSEVFFLGQDEARDFDLRVDRFGALAVTGAVAPNPPVSGQSFTLVLRVAKRTVDGEGIVRSVPAPAAAVLVAPIGGLVINSLPSAITGGDGTASFLASCRAQGALGVTATVTLTPTDAPLSATLDLPECAAPPATPTPPPSPSSTSTPPTTRRTTSTSTTRPTPN